MGTRRTRLAAGGAGVLLAAGLTVGSVAGADDASAAGCYDGAVQVTKAKGTYYSPSGDGWFKTTSACSDINFKYWSVGDKNGVYVKVCFQNGGCQDSYKWVPGIDENFPWKVIASNVKDGTKYKFRFLFADSTPTYRVAD